MSAITDYSIVKIETSIADDAGDFTVSSWVTSPDTGADPVYLTDTFNVSAMPPFTPLHEILDDGGYDVSTLP